MSSYNDDIFNQSDDDIFNDDSESSYDTSKAAEYMSNHMKEAHGIDINASDFISDDSDSHINLVRSKIFVSLAEASSTWVAHSNNYTFTVSTHKALDELTDGRYSKLFYLHTLEAKIIQRKIILQFLKMMSDTNHEDYDHLKKFLNLELDDIYIHSLVGTFLNIAKYTINSQIEIYLAMAKELNVVPHDQIEDIDNIVDLSFLQRKFIADSVTAYVTEEYLSNALSSFSSQKD